jgi:hypothetical protein
MRLVRRKYKRRKSKRRRRRKRLARKRLLSGWGGSALVGVRAHPRLS